MIVLILLMRKSGYCYKLLRESKNWCFWTVVLEKTLESPLDSKEIQPIHPKGNQSWIVTGKTDAETETLATWCEELTHLKRPWCWERLKAGEEEDNGGWDGWKLSLTQWTWVWVNSGSWPWTGRPGVLQSMGLQRVRHNWVTELTDLESDIFFPAGLGLHCCVWVFSRGSKRELLSGCGAWTSHCSDFSCCRAWALACAGFSSCSI